MRFAQELPFITLYFRLNSLLYSADIQGISSAREPDILRSADKWYLLSEQNREGIARNGKPC